MKIIETQVTEYGSQSFDAYATIIAPNYSGRVRLYEHEVTVKI